MPHLDVLECYLLVELAEPLLLVERDALLYDLLNLPRENRVERKVTPEAVVGAPRVLVVVRADLLGARARAHLHCYT